MPIPLITHHVTIMGVRPQSAVDPDSDGYDSEDAPTPVTLVTSWPASITSPTSQRESEGGLGSDDTALQVDEYAFRCNPTDISRFDYIIDDATGDTYQVTAVAASLPVLFGLEHITGRIKRVKGLPQ
jgi:hypothetical protein